MPGYIPGKANSEHEILAGTIEDSLVQEIPERLLQEVLKTPGRYKWSSSPAVRVGGVEVLAHLNRQHMKLKAFGFLQQRFSEVGLRYTVIVLEAFLNDFPG